MYETNLYSLRINKIELGNARTAMPVGIRLSGYSEDLAPHLSKPPCSDQWSGTLSGKSFKM